MSAAEIPGRPEWLETMCPSCGGRTGEHTVEKLMTVCSLDGHSLPWQPTPDHPGRAVELSKVADSVDVESAWAPTPAGRVPVLTMVFHNSYAGLIGSQTIVMPAGYLKDLARLIATSVDQACVAARRGRK